MTEIMARISSDARVEVIDDRSTLIKSVEAMAPPDAAYLARGLLACAVALSGQNPPKAGTIVGDAHMPVMKWMVGTSKVNGEPVLILTVPPGIELTFQMPSKGAKDLGNALLSQGEGTAPPEGHRGTIH